MTLEADRRVGDQRRDLPYRGLDDTSAIWERKGGAVCLFLNTSVLCQSILTSAAGSFQMQCTWVSQLLVPSFSDGSKNYLGLRIRQKRTDMCKRGRREQSKRYLDSYSRGAKSLSARHKSQVIWSLMSVRSLKMVGIVPTFRRCLHGIESLGFLGVGRRRDAGFS